MEPSTEAMLGGVLGLIAGAGGASALWALTRPRSPKKAYKGRIIAPKGEDGVYRWRGMVGTKTVVQQPLRGKTHGFIAESQALQNAVDVLIDTEWQRPPELSQVKW